MIDIYQQPGLARENQIVATPTLIIEFPPPLRRFIGNLTNITGLFVELDLVKKIKIADFENTRAQKKASPAVAANSPDSARVWPRRRKPCAPSAAAKWIR